MTDLDRPANAPDTAASRKLILVVDDDDDARFVVSRILEQEGYRVAVAVNGAEALEVARAEKPALILLDLMMPVMNGMDFRHAQMADPELSHVPCLIASAHFDAPAIARGLGAVGVIRKPLNFAALATQVANALRPDQQASKKTNV